MPPLAILRGRSGREFTFEDRVLAVAHVMAEDLLCSGCGQPKHESYNPDSEGWYVVQDTTCSGCQALARDSDIHKDYQFERKTWVVDERPADVALKPWTPGT